MEFLGANWTGPPSYPGLTEVFPRTGSDGLVSTATPGHGACPWCSGEYTNVIHSGPCPRIKAIEYHPNGTIKRVEFNEG